MSSGAWTMLAVGAIGLWGGLIYFLWVAYKARNNE
ncbi:MetS family NSS transporter small subunit [Thermoflavimicrobium daqui]|jgi:hypothetical protein|uniref:MetS family NSS transporter small subunit n=1 Tax=Thermoflavimicrobium daqui TaxID=2137476 RepID=A0A364K147_9BACL|nr:MetS family NSS transporter small subunit [Thermoflavimicrobium daqui]RAL21407.1 hypothetical protein DL897_16290 [Thermoflavimicrobium daqui]